MQHCWVWPRGRGDLIDRVELGAHQQLLLVRDPLASGCKHRMRCARRSPGYQADALGDSTCCRVVAAGVVELGLGLCPPPAGGLLLQRRRIGDFGWATDKDLVRCEFSEHQVGREAREVEPERFDLEVALASGDDHAIDDVEVAVVHVGAPAVDVEPCPAVEDRSDDVCGRPAVELGDLAGPADVAQRLRLEVAAVVEREIPVTVGSPCALDS